RDLGNDRRVISWTAFPVALLAQGLTRQQAFERADEPGDGRNVQDEYLEWFVHRDTNGEMVAVDFTWAGPEYWEYRSTTLSDAEFTMLYQLANSSATAKALFDADDNYNPRHEFNSTKGIMH